jgi:hypothetical protein
MPREVFRLQGSFKKLESSPRRIIAGYANMAITDHEGDLITVQAWQKASARFMASGFENVNIQHQNITVGRVIPEYTDSEGTAWKTHVDDNGWFVVCEIRSDLMIADLAWDLIEKKKLKQFSISGNALPEATEIVCEAGEGCHRRIDDIEMYEVNLCEEGINPGTAFMILKSKGCCKDCAGTLCLKKRGPGNLDALVSTYDDWAGGTFSGCVAALSGKPDIDNPEALCAWITHEATGNWPGSKELAAVSQSRPKRLDSNVEKPTTLENQSKGEKENLTNEPQKPPTEKKADPPVAPAAPPAAAPTPPPAGTPPGVEKNQGEQKQADPNAAAIVDKLDQILQLLQKLVGEEGNEENGEGNGDGMGAPGAMSSSAKAEPPAAPAAAPAAAPPAAPPTVADLVAAEVKAQLDAITKQSAPLQKRSKVPGAGTPSGPDNTPVVELVKKAHTEAGWNGVEALAEELRRKAAGS